MLTHHKPGIVGMRATWVAHRLAAPVSAKRVRRVMMGALLAAALLAAHPVATGALEIQSGYRVDTAIEGVKHPTAIAFAPGGLVFVAEHNGRIQVFDGITDPQPQLSIDLMDNVHSYWDRGLLGMKLDPRFPSEPYVYVSYTYDGRPGEEAPAHHQGADGSDTCERIKVAPGATLGDELPHGCVATGRIARYRLDPVSGVATGDPEEELVTDWCQQYVGHSMGDIEFDAEGALLGTGGDGANFNAYDYGQFGNPCGDPVNEGGSLRSQDIRTAGDPLGYNGSLIRIDPVTGAALPSNPLFSSPIEKARRVVAHGLRNAFRFEIRPGTNELYIGDVGAGSFEEIDLIPNLPAGPSDLPDPFNFGWPCFEGNAPEPGFQALSKDVPLPLCQGPYSSPPANLQRPFFSYPRTGELFAGDTCEAGGAAIAGLAFYEPPESPPVGALPADMEGDLLITDAARGCVWAMSAGAGGRPDPGQLQNLIVRTPADDGAFTPTDAVIGPDGFLYMPDFWSDRIARLRFFAGNQPPLARVAADPTSGPMVGGEFTVQFDGTGSTDAEDETLTYAWDLDGDGDFDDSSLPAPQRTYTEERNVIAQLRVTDLEGADDIARAKLYPGDSPPLPTIESPGADRLWTVGDEISLVGSATDPDGDEPTLDWDVRIQHCPLDCHSHPLVHFADTGIGNFNAPDHEHPSHLLLTFTATDDRGLAVSESIRLDPREVGLTLESEPPGIPLTLGPTTLPAPFAKTLIAGGSANISAPDSALVDGREYVFESWSDGGAQTHLVAPTESGSLIARYADPTEKRGPAGRVKLTLTSQPAKLPLRVGDTWRRGGTVLWVARGRSIRLAAHRRVRHRGRIYVFERWGHDRRRAHTVRMTRSQVAAAIYKFAGAR